MTFIFLLMIITVLGCASTSISSGRKGLQLVADQTMNSIPFSINLTARLNKQVFAELNTNKIILLWTESKPTGSVLRSREEYELKKEDTENKDIFFSRSYNLDEAGRHNFYLILFPDEKERRIVSNRVSILARAENFELE